MNSAACPFRKKLPGPALSLLLSGLAFSVGTETGCGQSYQWTGAGGDTAWATSANWTPVTNPVPSNADFLLSNNGGSLTQAQIITLAVDRIINGLTFDSKLAYTINSSPTSRVLTFGDGTTTGSPFILINTGTGPQANFEINSPVTFAEFTTITNNSTDNLTFNGSINNTGGLAIYGSGGTSIDGASYTGAGGLSKYGTGTLFMRKTNITAANGAPDTVIYEGIVSVENNVALFYSQTTTAPTIDIRSGASMMLDYPGTIDFTPGDAAGTYGGINAVGGGAHYATQGDIGALYAAPLLNGTASIRGNNTDSPIRLQGDTSVGAFEGSVLSIANSIKELGTGGYNLTKVGQGVVAINTTTINQGWTGSTIIKEGLLTMATPPVTRIVLNGGVFSTTQTTDIDPSATVNNVNITKSVGSGAGQILWQGDGGFAAYGTNVLVVDLGGSLTPATVTWGSGGFVPDGNALILGDQAATGYHVDFRNGINLGNSVREIRTIAGEDPGTDARWALGGRLSGVLTGTGGINKTGDGVLALTGTNTYSGETRISDGALTTKTIDGGSVALSGTIPNTHIVLDGGVYMPSGNDGATTGSVTWSPSLGTAAGQVSWGGNGGGFAAYNQQTPLITLNNNATTPLIWGSTTGFLTNSDTLVLGSGFSDGTVTLNNAIDLNSASRIIRVDDGLEGGADPDAVLSQNISGTGALNIIGDGQLNLTAANTTTASVNISGTTVGLTGANGSLNSAASIGISNGGTLISGDTTEKNNRINDAATVSLNGGNLILNSDNASPALTETIAGLQLTGGANTVTLDGQYTRLNVTGALTRSGNATVNFAPSYIGDNTTWASAVSFGTPPTAVNGVIPWATVTSNGSTGQNFAVYNTTTGSIDAATTTTTAASAWTSTTNFMSNGGETLTADRTVNSMTFDQRYNSPISGNFGLTVASGGILANLGANSTNTSISTSTLKSGTTELIVSTPEIAATTNVFTINAAIQDASPSIASTLIKSGNGDLVLGGTTANTNTGGAIIQEGTVILAKTGTGVNSVALSGSITVGDHGGDDTLQLNGSNQFGSGTSLTLAGGLPTTDGDPSGTATLKFNGQTTAGSNLPALDNSVATLTISLSGTIDFSGGLNDAPNYLRVSDLKFNSPNDRLTITNWREFQDYLLIPDSEIADFATYANQIHFEGYEGTSVITKYDDTHWSITPLGAIVPEPATTTSLLAAAALLLNRRRRKVASS